jgi:hypothetical protein
MSGIPQQFTNFASSILAASITPVSLSLIVNTGDGALFPALSAGQYFVAAIVSTSNPNLREIVKVTARSGDTMTIVRGQEGTIPQSWSASDIFELRLTAGGLAVIASAVQSASSIAALRLLSGNIDGQPMILTGYYTEGDGGGGPFYWNAASVAADNGGTIIAPTGVSTGRWYRLYDGVLNVRWFGAKGDNVNDDTPAFTSCITLLGSTGGEIFVPPGSYSVTTIDLSSAKSIILSGTTSFGAGAAVSTEIISAIATGFPVINCQSSSGLKITNLFIYATNSSHTGNVIDASSSAYFKMNDCYAQGGGSSNSALSIINSQDIALINSHFAGNASYNIQGKSISTDVCNGVLITGSVFHSASVAHIFNPGEGWVISGNVFEALSTGKAGAIGSATNFFSSGLSITGNWLGDVTSTTSAWQFDLYGTGISITGNFIGGQTTNVGGIRINGTSAGILISGNDFVDLQYGISLTPGGNFNVTGNNYTAVTTPVTLPKPTGVPAGAMGTSPPAIGFAGASCDNTGYVEFGTGTGTAAGTVMNVDFSTTLPVAPAAVIISPVNPATIGLQLYVNQPTTTGFSVGCNVAPAASQGGTTYRFTYVLIFNF